jgi:hypothetical protein
MATVARQCKAKTKNGKPCGGYAVTGSRFCLTHDPGRARERAERNRAGGLARLSPKATEGQDAPKIATVADVLNLVNATIADLWLLENSVPRARGLLAAAEGAIKALQAGELGARVATLEAVLSSRKVD